MIFVPLSLFAFLCLVPVLIWFAKTQDLSRRAHQLFLMVIALYAVQSLLVTLRWGYGMHSVGLLAGVLAPLMPVGAYLAYKSLCVPLKGARLWPMTLVALNWGVLIAAPPDLRMR